MSLCPRPGILALFGALWFVATGCPAHELQGNRATLVLRDRHHLSLTLYVDGIGVLHRTLAPGMPHAEFVAVHAAMPPDEFADQLRRAQSELESATRLTGPEGEAIALQGWTWPPAAAMQATLQQRAMEMIVAPQEHAHVEPVEIRAEAATQGALDALSLRLAAGFGPVLVVWYQPHQQWVEPGAEARLGF